MQGIHAPQKAAAKGRYQDGRCERALRASGQGKLVCVSVWSLQHFQERSVVCSPEQSERAGENTVPLSRDSARLVRVSVDTWNFRPKDLLRLVVRTACLGFTFCDWSMHSEFCLSIESIDSNL